MIISVHVPKTAGSSFRAILEQFYGGRLLLDYGDLPINTPANVRHAKALSDAAVLATSDLSDVDCIHGHFLPRKYLPLKNTVRARFVTWLREPLSRAISHYNFWKRTYNSASAPPLHRRVCEESWSLERFCFSDELKNFYAQFFWDFPTELFDFIGITERFSEDLSFFSRRFLQLEASCVPKVNAAPANQSRTALVAGFRERFEEFHAEDYRIYRAALAVCR